MAGNKTKEAKNQHLLPYYFISFPSCWQHALLNATPGKEVHHCFTPCAFFRPVVRVSVIDFNELLTPVAKMVEWQMTNYVPWHNQHHQGHRMFLSPFQEER